MRLAPCPSVATRLASLEGRGAALPVANISSPRCSQYRDVRTVPARGGRSGRTRAASVPPESSGMLVSGPRRHSARSVPGVLANPRHPRCFEAPVSAAPGRSGPSAGQVYGRFGLSRERAATDTGPALAVTGSISSKGAAEAPRCRTERAPPHQEDGEGLAPETGPQPTLRTGSVYGSGVSSPVETQDCPARMPRCLKTQGVSKPRTKRKQ